MRPPLNAISPTVVLSIPSSIGPCDDLVIDATGSYGNGGKPWSSVRWNVVSVMENAKDLTIFLNQNCTDISSIILIPNKLLVQTNTYTLSLVLTNIFGMSSAIMQQFHVMSTKDSNKPLVSISGPPVITLYRWQPIQLIASAVTVQCGVIVPGNVSYSWKLYQGFQLLNTISSQSIDPKTFLLSPYTLLPSTIYTLQVVVSLNKNRKQSTTDLVLINTGVSGVVSTISGGAEFSTSNDASFTLDASGSYDIDFPTESSLVYTWQCREKSPNFGAACPSTLILGKFAVVTVPANTFTLSSSSTYTYTFTVFVQNSFNASSTSSILVTLVKGDIATAVIRTPTSKFNSNSPIALSAVITVPPSFSGALASWNTTSIPFSVFNAAARTQLNSEFSANSQTAFYLVIVPGYLSAGGTYTFSLSIVGKSSLRTTSATCSVTIVMNLPPVGGILRVSPSTGIALQTVRIIVDISTFFTQFKLN